jgi:hypothetical protein
LRERISERERFDIEDNYHWVVTGDWDKENEIDEAWARAYPRDGTPLNNMSVLVTCCFPTGSVASFLLETKMRLP